MAASDGPGPVIAKPEAPQWMQDKAKDPDAALWQSAYDKVEKAKHYQKGEGPIPAMMRMQKEGMLGDLSLDDISKAGWDKVKTELGPKGSLGGRNFYKSSDSVLTDAEEQKEVKHLVDQAKAKEEADRKAREAQEQQEKAAKEAKEKAEQAERLSPQVDKIKAAIKPEIQTALANQHLETDPDKIHKGIAAAINADNFPVDAMKKRPDGSFPILDGYIGTGAITPEQRDKVLADQIAEKKWRDANPSASAEDIAKHKHNVGQLLRIDYPDQKDKFDAADALLTALQPPRQ